MYRSKLFKATTGSIADNNATTKSEMLSIGWNLKYPEVTCLVIPVLW